MLPRSRTLSTEARFSSLPCTPVTRARSTGSSRGDASDFTDASTVAQRLRLILLHVDQEHVGRVRLQRDGEFARQVHLQQPHAEDEEHAEADGQQNHPGLMTGTPEPIDRVPQREPLHASERPHRAHHSEPDEVQGDRREHEPDRHDAAHPPRRRLPAREQHEHGDDRSAGEPLDADRARASASMARDARGASRGPRSRRSRRLARRGPGADVSSRSNSSGRTRRTSSSGTSANSSDTRTPMPKAWRLAEGVRPTEIAPSAAKALVGAASSINAPSARPIRLPAAPSSSTCTT